MYVTFRVEKVARISSQCTYLCNFQKTIQIKQSPNTRKFAQSGHPGQEQQKERKKERKEFQTVVSKKFERKKSDKASNPRLSLEVAALGHQTLHFYALPFKMF
jgi:hypothetical protein